MRRRLRECPTPTELAVLYATEYDHKKWDEHVNRVRTTIALAAAFGEKHGVRHAADLSCGDGEVLTRLDDALDLAEVYYGDVVGEDNDLTGPIEETIYKLPPVDLFILSETLEHLCDPDLVLKLVRSKTKFLVLSTPLLENSAYENGEHIWEWDTDGVREMLDAAGFEWEIMTVMKEKYYTYQLWLCR